MVIKMEQNTHQVIYRKDYTPFPFRAVTIDLFFDLRETYTQVVSTVQYSRIGDVVCDLLLYGEQIELESVTLNGRVLDKNDYVQTGETLTISAPPEEFTLVISGRIYPETNQSLEGLYKSSGNYCTQCEAQGFRKITYFPDRPDVLSVFTTRIEGSAATEPVMLSNGNLEEKGILENGRHYTVWKDPFPKPSYLFALVAGDLFCVEDRFTTASGKEVVLQIYVEHRNSEKCDHAMASLKKAMTWDEDTFGLEYDLDTYMIVAVDDFNMGAMENKGLNIFNSKYVLTTPESATDQDYLGVEGVIGHEYFHNWTGNRVTCRDWFQLSLKEGLTVFRDQEFSADMNSRAVQRIEDVRLLKNVQFKEDSGPMAHPVRPDSFVEINNFYTATVYNKGAEVIRMMQTILGRELFRKGVELYIARHDGQAVTCEDFVVAMSDASGVDLTLFRNWYRQAGTPELEVNTNWNEQSKEFEIEVGQYCPDTPGQKDKAPFHIPIAVGLVVPGQREGNGQFSGEETTILHLKESKQKFSLKDVPEKPVLSFLRDFSAPVRVKSFQTRDDLALLAQFDANLYNRWDSFTRLATEVILELAEAQIAGREQDVDPLLLDTIETMISGEIKDKALLALSLQLPAESALAQDMEIIFPLELHCARKKIQETIACKFRNRFIELYEQNSVLGKYSITPEAIAGRSLQNTCLSYLMADEAPDSEILQLCKKQFYESQNMTETMAALHCITHVAGDLREELLENFYNTWSADPLVLDKWFTVQAISSLPDTLGKVKKLMKHNAFSITNPNKVRALVGAFCSANSNIFHSVNGEGYILLRDVILQLNGLNPQIAARLAGPLTSWKHYEQGRANLMRAVVEEIANTEGVSRDVFEIVNKSLAV